MTVAAYNFFEGCDLPKEPRQISAEISQEKVKQYKQVAQDNPTSPHLRRKLWRALLAEMGLIKEPKLGSYTGLRDYVRRLIQDRIKIPRLGAQMRSSLAEYVLRQYAKIRIDGEPETLNELIKSFQTGDHDEKSIQVSDPLDPA
ncbi:MAG: hypothetical protein J6S27_02060 [Thermoguttaceae bacterium]|nr:hypothetical protein [Thermoguttaceae bacterium]